MTAIDPVARLLDRLHTLHAENAALERRVAELEGDRQRWAGLAAVRADQCDRLRAARTRTAARLRQQRRWLVGVGIGTDTGCCGICWTTSWAPCPSDHPAAHHDETGSYLCQHCVVVAALATAAAQRDALRAKRTRTAARFRELRMTAGVLWAAIEAHREAEQAMRRERDGLRALLRRVQPYIDCLPRTKADAQAEDALLREVEAALASATTPEEER